MQRRSCKRVPWEPFTHDYRYRTQTDSDKQRVGTGFRPVSLM